MEDIEIARRTDLKDINDIARKINISEEYVENYGKYKSKISLDIFDKIKSNKDGKLILVTSINPTPLGEGKTTASIGISDGLNKLGKKRTFNGACVWNKRRSNRPVDARK